MKKTVKRNDITLTADDILMVAKCKNKNKPSQKRIKEILEEWAIRQKHDETGDWVEIVESLL